MGDADKEQTCSQTLFKKDNSIFREYIENTTAHGVVRIFSGRSISRRLFWLLLVLAATAGCLRTVHSHPLSGSIQLEELVYYAGHVTDDVISDCEFCGKPCSRKNFDLIVTSYGLCYTFNSGRHKPVLNVTGTGARQALTAFIDIQQDQYVASPALDAGLIVVVHPQSEPPLPLDLGIAVAPGTHAFISLTRRDVVDHTRSQCRSESDLTGFNYLQGEFNYSVSACTLDCFLSQVARKCGCSYIPSQYPPDTPAVSRLRNCTLLDICCIQLEAYAPEQCDCSSACEAKHFSTFTS